MEIQRTLRAYRSRKPDGSLRIPRDKQRPILMIGPPGIGKTAIMAQIADQEQIGLVSYTMTHHTRQSAIGLPMLSEGWHDGASYTATRYTMSEMIASIYDNGSEEGILFLDEINCVSETLAPVMLQLLQNKTFGTHVVPEGWIIAAAGNPPEYNRSVRSLDMATLDRVKHMEIEADLGCWMEYAREHKLHPAIISFLTACPQYFYRIEDRPEGQLFVTARGWEDLSCILEVYEETHEPIGEELMLQYLQHDEIAREFWLYYDLFRNSATPDSLEHQPLSRCMSAAAHRFSAISALFLKWKEGVLLDRRVRELLPATEERILSARKALKIIQQNHLVSAQEADFEELAVRTLEQIWHTGQMPALSVDEAVLTEQLAAAYRFLKTADSPLPGTYFTQELLSDPDCLEFLSQHPIKESEAYLPQMLLSARETSLLNQL
ncbi:MAG: AAA family ATPase [Eubacteriales bacterium]|nr:AAA family ATPase [Eubacteriales bacterium]